jgi:hypothetical protein
MSNAGSRLIAGLKEAGQAIGEISGDAIGAAVQKAKDGAEVAGDYVADKAESVAKTLKKKRQDLSEYTDRSGDSINE